MLMNVFDNSDWSSLMMKNTKKLIELNLHFVVIFVILIFVFQLRHFKHWAKWSNAIPRNDHGTTKNWWNDEKTNLKRCSKKRKCNTFFFVMSNKAIEVCATWTKYIHDEKKMRKWIDEKWMNIKMHSRELLNIVIKNKTWNHREKNVSILK